MAHDGRGLPRPRRHAERALGSELFPTAYRSTASAARAVTATIGAALGLALEGPLFAMAGGHGAAISWMLVPLCARPDRARGAPGDSPPRARGDRRRNDAGSSKTRASRLQRRAAGGRFSAPGSLPPSASSSPRRFRFADDARRSALRTDTPAARRCGQRSASCTTAAGAAPRRCSSRSDRVVRRPSDRRRRW